MSYQLHGYLIDDDFHFDIETRCLYRLSANEADKNVIFGALFLNKTMKNVFLYLLQNGTHRGVPKQELFIKVWEENNLTPSTQRVWNVLNGLNKKLTKLGMPENIISYFKGEGYRITLDNVICLYRDDNIVNR